MNRDRDLSNASQQKWHFANRGNLSYARAAQFGVVCILLLIIAVLIFLHTKAAGETAKAARLEEAALALEPGRSTFADVRAVVAKYGSPGDYEAPCDEALCSISIAPFSFSFQNTRFDKTLLRAIGVRPASYEVWILVLNGVVSRVEFAVFYRRVNGHWLRASTHSVDDFSQEERCLNAGLQRHPQYALLAGNSTKSPDNVFVRAEVSAKASPEERQHARVLDLSCVNSFRECGLGAIMPLAYADWQSDLKWEQEHHEQLAREEAACKPQLRPTRFLSPFVAPY